MSTTLIATVTSVYFDNARHPYVRGSDYADPSGHRRIGPRGGRLRMSHDVEADREALMSCAQVVARHRDNVLALCGRPAYQHPDRAERIERR